MRVPGRVERSPLWVVRGRARAPRAAVVVVACVLSAAGLRSLLTPRPVRSEPSRAPVSGDTGARAVAEAFARAYLSFDPRRPELRSSRLADFGAALDDPSASSSGRERRSVRWTTVVADHGASQRRRIITVAADDGRTVTYLAVPVARDRANRLF